LEKHITSILRVKEQVRHETSRTQKQAVLVTMLQTGRLRVQFPIMILDFFFNLSNPSSCTMALEFTQPLTEMSTQNLPGGKVQLVHKSDKLTAICEPTVQKMWDA
jgi:hypothetical protein